jgi:hypothetical protein
MCAGCIPSVPFVAAETAETLEAREVSAAVYGGGGVFTGSSSSGPECCGGAMGRLRVGIGHAQEVGIDAGAYFSGHPGKGSIWGTGKLGWKLRLGEHYALVGGAGLTFIDRQVGVGGDFGALASTRLGARPLSLYTGLRGTLMVAAARDVYGNGGVSGGALLPLGVAWDATRRLRLLLEAGLVGGANVEDLLHNGKSYSGWFGSYGALAVSYAWRR